MYSDSVVSNGPRRLNRRALLESIGLASFGVILAACGAPAPSPTAAPAAKPAEQPAAGAAAPTPTQVPQVIVPTPVPKPGLKSGQVYVEYWHNFGAGLSSDVHMKQIQMFHDSQQKYVVDIQYVPTTTGTQLSEKLIASITAGTPPSAARFDRFIVTSWAARGFLEDVTDQAKRDGVTQDKFIKEGWLEATWQGKVYAVPFDTDLRGLYYNKKHFQEAGLDPSKPPTTIAELEQYADKLTVKDGAKYKRVGFSPWVGQGGFCLYGWMWGGEFYDRDKNLVTLNHPKVVEALEWIVKWAKKFDIEMLDSAAQAYGTNEQEPFTAGLVSMISQGDWHVANLGKYMKPEDQNNWDVVPYPKVPGGPDKVTWGGGWATVLPKGSKEKDGGWALAKYLGVDAAATYAIETTHIPVYLPAYDDLEKNKSKFDPRWTKFWPLKEVCRFRPNIPVGQELWNAQSQASDLARHFKEEPKSLLERLNANVNAELAKYK